jgi:hypothetical protein
MRSKGRVREEHEPLTYEQTQKEGVYHPSSGSKGSAHEEHKPLNDEHRMNSRTYQAYNLP